MKKLLSLLCLLCMFASVAGAEEPSKSEAVGKEREQMLQAIGALSAAQLYQAYLNVCMLADGRAAGTYSAEESQAIMATVISVLATVDRQLIAIGKLDLDKADRAKLKEIRDIAALIHKQSLALQAYWKTGGQKEAAVYDKYHAEAWQKLSSLLGLQAKK